MAQQSHGRHHAQIRLAIVGEDGQEKDGVGMEMQRLQPVVAEDLIEEIREGGNQPCGDTAREEGEERASLGLRTSEATRSSVFPLSLLSPAVSKHVAERFFSVKLGASRASSNQASAEEDLTLRSAIGRRCGARSKKI